MISPLSIERTVSQPRTQLTSYLKGVASSSKPQVAVNPATPSRGSNVQIDTFLQSISKPQEKQHFAAVLCHFVESLRQCASHLDQDKPQRIEEELRSLTQRLLPICANLPLNSPLLFPFGDKELLNCQSELESLVRWLNSNNNPNQPGAFQSKPILEGTGFRRAREVSDLRLDIKPAAPPELKPNPQTESILL